MTVAFPWSGRDVNALVPLSGRAAVPNTPAGTGFNWPSLTGRISGYVRPVRGWSGMRGLGQLPSLSDATSITDNLQTGTSSIGGVTLAYDPNAPIYVQSDFPASGLNNFPNSASTAASGASASSSQAPWWGSILSNAISGGLKVGTQIASYELNPLTNKQTYYQTPQGAVYASNVPTGSVIPGLTTGTGSSILPMLLIGGVLMMFMMSRR